MKKIYTILATMFITMMVMSSVADAKGGSFGGRSSGGSFSSGSRSISIGGGSRSSSSSSWSSRPSSPGSSAFKIGGGAAAAGYSSSSSSSSKPAPIKVTRDNVLSSLGNKGAKGDAAGILYKDFQSRNASPIKTNGKLNTADIDRVFSPSYRQSRRSDYYGRYNPTPTTHYRDVVYANHSGGYGIWDLMLFNSIMDNVGDRQMYYHHMNDPAFQDWRRDANAACAAGDRDVCDKLADLDREMSEYRQKGIQQNPSYMTPGVDPDIYEANNIDLSKLPEIKICTGAIGSDYSRFAAEVTKITKLKVKSIPSNGSVDNLAKMATGECDLGFVQDDLTTSSNLKKVVTLNQLEAGLLVCSKEPGLTTVAGLTDSHTIFVGSDQTGSQFTMDQLRKVVPSLARAKLDETHPTMEAVGMMASTPKSCMFAVSTPDFPGFKELDKSGKFQGIPLFSTHFTNKHPTYKLVTVDIGHYKNLTQEEYKSYGLGKSGGTDTIAVSTSMVAPQTWIDQNKQLYDLLMLERLNLQTSLQ